MFTLHRHKRMICRMRKPIAALIGLMTLAATAGPLLAQAAAEAKPGPPPPANPLVGYFIALLLVGVVCVGAMKSAKRSHQD